MLSLRASSSGKELRSAWDGILIPGRPACCLVATHPQPLTVFPCLQVPLIPAVAAGFSAGDIAKEIAELVGGRGGGKVSTMAQAGSNAAGIDAALEAVRTSLVRNVLRLCFR